MHPIPHPELLDADRTKSQERDDMTLMEHRSRAQELDDALHASCAYATELWQHLDAVRRYLFDSLPSDPRAPGTNPRTSAAPTGPDDDEGWAQWIETYATATSILAGPHGDSGFGLDEAKQAARLRREAPNLAVLAHAGHDSSESDADSGSGSGSAAATIAVSRRPGNDLVRTVGFGALVLLALRGLRPRR